MPVPYLIKGANKFIPSSMKVREAKVARLKKEHNYCSFNHDSRASSASDSSSESYDANNNSSPVKRSSSEEREASSGDETMSIDDVDGTFSVYDSVLNACQISPISKSSTEGACPNQTEPERHYWSLDTAFPEPASFSGINNPFLTDYEVEDLVTQRQYFVTHLEQLAQKFGNNFPDQSQSTFPHLSLNAVPSPSLKDLRGFKGELATLVHENNKVADSSSSSTSINHNGLASDKLSLSSSSSPSAALNSRRSLRHDTSSSRSPANNVRTSSQRSRSKPINGLRHIKTAPPEDVMDDNERKRLRNLSRCLKNLTPTCGFKFPILENGHPSLNGNVGQEENQPVSSTLPPHLGRRGRKRKHSTTPISSKSKSTEDGCENVRRSYRNRTTVQRFEIDQKDSNQECKENHATSSVLSSAKYNVISLRVRHDNTVDYLVDWCN